jgi:type I restriction enzyme M protein
VLFRGAAEGTIRQKLLEDGSIYAVIGLPGNMFYNTSIPTCIVVLKKHRPGRDVLFVDASKLFEKKKTQNVMSPAHIDRVMELYKNRQDVEKEAHLATFAEIKENGFNLNIPRYVDTFEEEPLVDIDEVRRNIESIEAELKEVQARMDAYLKELGIYE